MLSSLLQVRSRSNASMTAATEGSQTLLIGRNTPTSTPATSPTTARYIYIISISISTIYLHYLQVRGCDKSYTHPSSLRKHMKVHGKDAVWCGGDSDGER